MIRPTIERRIVVRDSDEKDESAFTIYVRDVEDVADEDTARHIMMPESVWLSLDDTEQLGHALIELAQAVRAEREPVAKAAPAKKTAARKRPARKATS